ncbi:MAG TPA: hypothetical protein VGD31_12570, partial [Sphingobacteriaceae bacterium]
MNVYLVGFRLFLYYFIFIHVIGIFIYSQTNLSFGIIAELVCMPGIYFLALISVKRYQHFFYNMGS